MPCVTPDGRISRVLRNIPLVVCPLGGGRRSPGFVRKGSLYPVRLWCFVALANILRSELNLTPRPPTWLRYEQRRVALELTRAAKLGARIGAREETCSGSPIIDWTLRSTGACQPDNTLEIFKRDNGSSFRYIFDAKYRLQDDPEYLRAHHAPGPPPDSIHRMHAYRDQIVEEHAGAMNNALPESTVWDLGYRRGYSEQVGDLFFTHTPAAMPTRTSFSRLSTESVSADCRFFLRGGRRLRGYSGKLSKRRPRPSKTQRWRLVPSRRDSGSNGRTNTVSSLSCARQNNSHTSDDIRSTTCPTCSSGPCVSVRILSCSCLAKRRFPGRRVSLSRLRSIRAFWRAMRDCTGTTAIPPRRRRP